MTVLTIMRGVSGSGKSTRARMIAEMTNAQIVSRDDIRKFMYGSDGPDYYAVDKETLSEREQRVSVTEQAMIESFLRAGINVIQDNTNIEWKYVKQTAKIGYRCMAEVKVESLDVPLATAIGRVGIRSEAGGRHVDFNIISKQYERFKKTKNLVLDEVIPPKPYTGTPGKPKAFMVDIDGTLAHMNDKRGPFDWKNVGLDDVDEKIADLVTYLEAGMSALETFHAQKNHYVIVMSGRDESCRFETELWLDDHAIPWDHLLMRPEKDMRPDNIIKAELFDKHVRDNFDVQFVIDDRDQVVRMWKMMGLKVLNVAGLDDGIF